VRVERLGAELGKQLARFVRAEDAPRLVAAIQPQPPELPRIANAKLAAIGQREEVVNVLVERLLGRDDGELPGHLHLDGDDRGAICISSVQRHDEPLCSPVDVQHLAPGHTGRELVGRGMAHGTRPVGPKAGDRPSRHERPKLARDRLDLGQFRHGRALSDRLGDDFPLRVNTMARLRARRCNS
jgi:hypothetical protein